MNLAFIFLFDTTGHISTIQRLEAEMHASRAGDRFRLFYLKMNSESPFEYKDFLYELKVTNDGRSFYNVGERVYNFKFEDDLEASFRRIASLCAPGTRFFFCTSGHGSAYGLGAIQYTPVEMTGTGNLPSGNQHSPYSSLIWNKSLVRALTHLRPAFLYFNNCHVNYFDSLYFYGGISRYIIATENYVNTSMLQLDVLINKLAMCDGKSDDHTMAAIAFEAARSGFLYGSKAPGMTGASLFLIDLQQMPRLLNIFNTLSGLLIRQFYNQANWYFSLLQEMRMHYVTSFDLIDMSFVLQKIGESLPAFPAVKEHIEAMLRLIEHMILDKITIEGDPYSNCQGISIYLPKGKKSYYTRIFTDYTRRYKASELPFDWYKLIDIAGKKMGYTH
ncbi:MAG: hypothetical protein J0H92_16610 [Sphingobacteriales bacterium]|nr:hypothetical protein [Sphingobacteriales bacterium]OJW31724.1 MAG: hypothetical protein BGO54_14855 [Sphingobacteriales bacterium 46-32]